MEKKTIYGINLMSYMLSRGIDLEFDYDDSKIIAAYEVDDYTSQVREDFFNNIEFKNYFKALKQVRDIRKELANAKGEGKDERTMERYCRIRE